MLLDSLLIAPGTKTWSASRRSCRSATEAPLSCSGGLAVEAYERSHESRPEVLAKLRYMRMSEPLEDYDALGADQVVELLRTADAETVKAVRDYERKFGQRRQVIDEAARVLPAAPASAAEDRAREGQDARVRDGFAGRDKTAGDLASRRPERP